MTRAGKKSKGRRRARSGPPLNWDDYPQLRLFIRDWFHEDWDVSANGSVDGCVRAFLRGDMLEPDYPEDGPAFVAELEYLASTYRSFELAPFLLSAGMGFPPPRDDYAGLMAYLAAVARDVLADEERSS